MAAKSPSRIVGSPADDLVSRLESLAAEELQLVVEYDNSSCRTLYRCDDVPDEVERATSIQSAIERLSEYYSIDFVERGLLGEMFWLGDVELFATFFDRGVVFRAQRPSAAMFVVLDDPSSVDDVRTAIRNTVCETA